MLDRAKLCLWLLSQDIIIIIMQIMNVSLELDHPHCTLVSKPRYTNWVTEVSAAIRVTDSYLQNIIFIRSKAKIF